MKQYLARVPQQCTRKHKTKIYDGWWFYHPRHWEKSEPYAHPLLLGGALYGTAQQSDRIGPAPKAQSHTSGQTHVTLGGQMPKPANDNGPLTAADFPDAPEGRAARRAWLDTAPATHAAHHAQPPCVTWAKREKDEATFMGLRLWRDLNEPPRMAANDNELDEEDTELGDPPALPSMDREMVDVSAKQLIWAFNNNRTRWVGNKLVKVWDGHAWVSPEERFTEVRQRKSDKADTEYFDAETPDAQAELARAMDTEKLRAQLGHKLVAVLDMASSDSTLAEIGEYLGFGGQYAVRMAGKEVRAAVAALNAALAEEGRLAA
jgi:hypothetical protein